MRILKAIFTCFWLLSLKLRYYCSLNVAVDSINFTDENFQGLIQKIDDFLEANNRFYVPKAVRLAFHDCISGCNGCINGQNPDNLGLKGIVTDSKALEYLYKDKLFYGLKLSRADLWILIAFRAIYIAAKQPYLSQPILDFKFGRIDCDDGALRGDKEILPSSLGNWTTVKRTLILRIEK